VVVSIGATTPLRYRSRNSLPPSSSMYETISSFMIGATSTKWPSASMIGCDRPAWISAALVVPIGPDVLSIGSSPKS
jgi:hypothetical protein